MLGPIVFLAVAELGKLVERRGGDRHSAAVPVGA